ncbi:MAG: chloride channel protein [Clostridia bacterium]|nr:chloride channel protein [Clostridia bacterium]
MFRKNLQLGEHYAIAFVYWAIAAVVVGLVCGAVGALFAISVHHATHLRGEYPWLLYLLPVGGILIALMYRFFKLSLNIGTDAIIKSVRTQEKVPILMAPAIFISTFITHLLGGSAGREGAALQLGGSIAAKIGDFAHPHKSHDDDRRIYELCGMAALFSALFGTPLTAAIFVIEVVNVGEFNYRAMLPCLISSLTAALTAKLVGAPEELFPLAAGLADTGALNLIRAAGLGVLCGIVAFIFCSVMHHSGSYAKKLIKNDYVRVIVGGAAIIALTLIIGSRDYNGGGGDVILAALAGEARPEAFILKILFTAITLSFGFKGGEIVPSFFIGSTFGCAAAAIFGLSPALGAGLGLVSVFCGVTNAPVASILLSIELFGAEYLPLMAIAICVSYMLSGQTSLYHQQHFIHPKLGAGYDGE